MYSDSSRQERGIRIVIGLFSVFSLMLLYVSWYASDLAPRLMNRNYRTVKYAAQMQGALTSIYIAAANAREPDAKDFDRFESNLAAERENITESEEPDTVATLESEWSKFRKLEGTPTLETFQKLSSVLEELTEMNERAMFAYEDRARTLGKTVLFGGVLGFALVLIYAVQILLSLQLNYPSEPKSPSVEPKEHSR